MKQMILGALLVFATASSAAAAISGGRGQAAEAFLQGILAERRVSGPAAQELYRRLSLPESELRDEHGGGAYGNAKYGEHFGCARFLDGSAECWFL